MRIIIPKIFARRFPGWLLPLLLLPGCVGTVVHQGSRPAAENLYKLRVGMTGAQVSKAMQWRHHSVQRNQTGSGYFEDWGYDQGKKRGAVILRFRNRRLLQWWHRK